MAVDNNRHLTVNSCKVELTVEIRVRSWKLEITVSDLSEKLKIRVNTVDTA